MTNEVQKLKADSYDVLIRIEQLNKEINDLKVKKRELSLKIEALEGIEVKPAEQDKPAGVNTVDAKKLLLEKEQRIMQKRLQKIKAVKAD